MTLREHAHIRMKEPEIAKTDVNKARSSKANTKPCSYFSVSRTYNVIIGVSKGMGNPTLPAPTTSVYILSPLSQLYSNSACCFY